jgi:putative flippase GtrA
MPSIVRRAWSRTTSFIRAVWAVRFLRFLVVGGINTLFGSGVFALFIWIGLHYTIAAFLTEICGILFNFKTTGTIVFGSKDNRLIFRFFAVYLSVYLLRIGFLKLFSLYGIGPLIAAAIIVLPMSLLAYLLQRKFVFNALQKSTKPAQ